MASIFLIYIIHFSFFFFAQPEINKKLKVSVMKKGHDIKPELSEFLQIIQEFRLPCSISAYIRPKYLKR